MSNLTNPPNELRTANHVIYEFDATSVAFRDKPTKATPRNLYLDRANCTDLKLYPEAAPASVEAVVYYDSTLHKLRVRGAAGFETITSV